MYRYKYSIKNSDSIQSSQAYFAEHISLNNCLYTRQTDNEHATVTYDTDMGLHFAKILSNHNVCVYVCCSMKILNQLKVAFFSFNVVSGPHPTLHYIVQLNRINGKENANERDSQTVWTFASNELFCQNFPLAKCLHKSQLHSNVVKCILLSLSYGQWVLVTYGYW